MRLLVAFSALWSACDSHAQDLEPRRWSHLPTGANFVGIGLANATGEIFLDPVIEAEDVDMDLFVLGGVYIRTFELLGKSARIDVRVPYATARWEGLLQGEPATRRRRGFMDPWLQMSVNLYGAPALRGPAFASYRAEHPVSTSVGAAIAVSPPLGEYFSDKLINLGFNRWTLRPQLGVLHMRGKWEFEATGSLFLFGDNREFSPGSRTREQDLLWSVQGHVVRTFKPGLWLGFGGAFAMGGRSSINGVPKDDDGRLSLWAVSLGLPISPAQGLNLAYVISRTNTDSGSNLDTFQIAWSCLLGR